MTFVNLDGEEAAAFVSLKTYRSILAFGAFSQRVSDVLQRDMSVPNVFADMFSHLEALKVSPECVKEFSDQLTKVSAANREIGTFPTQKHLKNIKNRQCNYTVQSSKEIPDNDEFFLDGLDVMDRAQYLGNRQIQAVLVNAQDAKFTVALREAFTTSTSASTRRKSREQEAYSAIIARAMTEYYNYVSEGQPMPLEILELYTESPKSVIEEARLQLTDDKTGVHLRAA